EHAGLAAAEEGVVMLPNQRDRASGDDQPCLAGGVRAATIPEAVIAIVGFEVAERMLRVLELIGRAGSRDDGQACEVGAGQRVRIVEREVRHEGHAVVLELPVTQWRRLPRQLQAERLDQPAPMRSEARRAVTRNVVEIALSLFVI